MRPLLVRHRAAALLFTLLVAGDAVGSDYESGAEAWRRGDYDAAIETWQPLAQAGHARSQFAIGLAFDRGRGVSRNAAEAARWYRRAASAGLADAQYNLGNLHVDGRGVSRDPERAVALFRAAAVQGHTPAQVNLAYSYEQGEGVEADSALAAAWYARAAMAGNREAGERFYDLRERGVRPAALPALAPAAEGAATEPGNPVDEARARPPGAGATGRAVSAAPAEPAADLPAAGDRENPPPAAPGGPRIRLAAYRSRANAERGWQLIRARHGAVLAGVGPLYESVDLGPERGQFLRLEAGPFPSRAAAREACAAIRAAGDDCLVPEAGD